MPFAESGALRTHYELTGDKRPVLLFSNSLGTDFSMWDPQMSTLSKRFRILRYDTRGHGQSSVTPGDYTMDQLGRDVLALLDTLGLDRVNFCGLSMGGAIGMWLGIHAPERFDRLVLCNTAAKLGTQETWNARIATVRNGGMRPVAAAVIERWYTPEFRAACPETVARTQHMLEHSPPEGYIGCCAAIRDSDLRNDVCKITSATLVIYGEKDPVVSPADAEFLVNQIRGAKKLGLNAAHLSNVEQADTFTQKLDNFLTA